MFNRISPNARILQLPYDCEGTMKKQYFQRLVPNWLDTRQEVITRESAAAY